LGYWTISSTPNNARQQTPPQVLCLGIPSAVARLLNSGVRPLKGIRMRIRLCAGVAGIGLALAAIAETPRPSSRGPEQVRRPTAVFNLPEIILDGSEHADQLFPQFADFDGDGVTDLTLGVGDRLLVYRNRVTNAHPVYDKPTWFDETEPSARLPHG
jgi:hypothetical protein